jgi:hypothetical protein
MALTRKRQDQLYDDLVRRQTNLVRGMLTPRTIATKIYPHLPSADQPSNERRNPDGSKTQRSQT